ncbi:MAG: hypothetical protein KBS62_08050 [Oscillospiraceae bacterium]|nr:hypothetical protein [Candidatus Ruminococcus equi]
MESERTVMRAVNSNSSNSLDAARFILKTIGKDEGYSEKQEQDIKVSGSEINVTFGKTDED